MRAFPRRAVALIFLAGVSLLFAARGWTAQPKQDVEVIYTVDIRGTLFPCA